MGGGSGHPRARSAELVAALSLGVGLGFAQLAEFMEVAYWVGAHAATAPARKRADRQFNPALAGLLCVHAEEILGGLDAVLAWQAALRLKLPGETVLMLRPAGLVYGFGRLGVSNSIWDRP
ncbi:MAG TPA: hypothetical protein VFQ68_32445 [Streptosporangiaceae bacterium]|nr:hypothetical protein [Streptosporangiaceae bacterium]